MYRKIFYLTEGDLIKIGNRVFKYLDYESYTPQNGVGTFYKIILEELESSGITVSMVSMVCMRDDFIEVLPKLDYSGK